MRNALILAAFIAVAEAAGIAGSFITFDAIPTWYDTLTLPPFAPPKWLFGPVWTTLYALMGTAAFIVWRSQKGSQRSSALGTYWAQLALNAAWTPVFFGLKELWIAFAVIIVMLIAILVTVARFWPISRVAAALLIPYVCWVSFASLLNLSLAYLNAS